MNKQKNKGISLIVLVITIIVMIVLAGAVIISLSQNGIVGKANEAVNDTDFQQIKQAALLAWADAYAGGARDVETLKEAVDTALVGVDTSKYKVAVTENGVTIKDKSQMSITLDKTAITETITTGLTEEVTLTATVKDIDTLTWTTTNEEVATVVANGNEAIVTLRGEGTAEIKVTGEDITAVCTVTVTEEVLDGQQINFSLDSGLNLYAVTLNNICVLENGKTYVVEWDGTEYVCTARRLSYNSSSGMTFTNDNAIGNAKIFNYFFGLELTTTAAQTSEPFLINYADGYTYIRTKDTSASHVIRIYEQESN